MIYKGADQTAQMRRLVCACVFRKPPKTGFLASRSIYTGPRSAVRASPIAEPEVASLTPARSHTFVEIDHEIISMVSLLLPLSKRVVVSYKQKYVHEVQCTQAFKRALLFLLFPTFLFCSYFSLLFLEYALLSLLFHFNMSFTRKNSRIFSSLAQHFKLTITFFPRGWLLKNTIFYF